MKGKTARALFGAIDPERGAAREATKDDLRTNSSAWKVLKSQNGLEHVAGAMPTKSYRILAPGFVLWSCWPWGSLCWRRLPHMAAEPAPKLPVARPFSLPGGPTAQGYGSSICRTEARPRHCLRTGHERTRLVLRHHPRATAEWFMPGPHHRPGAAGGTAWHWS